MSNTAVQIKPCETKHVTDVVENTNSIYKLFSFEEVKEVTNRALNDDATVVEYALQPYSEGKLGYLSSHYRLDVRASTKKEETVSLTFFLKTIPFEVPEQADYAAEKGVFEKEAKFYGVIMPLLREGFREKPWSPMCYKVTNNYIAFEDLGGEGYSTRDKLFDETLVRAGLNSLARLHAASLLAEARLDVPFNQLHPDAFTEKAFDREGLTRKWMEVGFELAVVIAKRHGFDPHLVRVACERIYDITEPSSTKMNVVSHGDLWGNNLMFNNDVPPNCLLVDYQLLRYTPMAHDIAQFLYLCTDRSFRETRENAMLRYYYETLCEILDDHGAVRRPCWSEIVQGMEEQRLGALITAVLLFPTILMDESLGMEIMGDSETYAKIWFEDRTEFVLSNIKKDSIYERRITEAVVELAELASRLDQLPKPS
ncbi:uncharacterized protein LOC114936288 [Nylanderia fulva]|uniref:uncharacterized protein LOC114936288 n=1 Tax=Nylanderia fulva TaxID=613905 RepID=UPI0010FBAB8C|nr:uncharacterized protein LOC114936288 [Nylanderia fulva]